MLELVQRWRIIYRRGPSASELAQRAESEAWERAVLDARLPVVGADAGRPRLGFAIPLPVGLTADAERFDLPLAERLTAHAVRSALEPVVPAGHAIVELHDVWIGEPSLVSRVVAADYRLSVRPAPVPAPVPGSAVGRSTACMPLPPGALATACRRLMATERLDRLRRKAEREVAYDLRPLLIALAATEDPPGEGTGGAPRAGLLRMRLRADQTVGVGRPDEVMLAVAEALATPLEMVEGTRERLWLADELTP
jgi:hypothetical protein